MHHLVDKGKTLQRKNAVVCPKPFFLACPKPFFLNLIFSVFLGLIFGHFFGLRKNICSGLCWNGGAAGAWGRLDLARSSRLYRASSGRSCKDKGSSSSSSSEDLLVSVVIVARLCSIRCSQQRATANVGKMARYHRPREPISFHYAGLQTLTSFVLINSFQANPLSTARFSCKCAALLHSLQTYTYTHRPPLVYTFRHTLVDWTREMSREKSNLIIILGPNRGHGTSHL